MTIPSVPRLAIEMFGAPPVVQIRRVSGIPDDFWLRLRAEFAGDAEVERERMRIPPELFLTFRELLRSICAQYQVGIEPDAATRELLVRAQREQALLGALLEGVRRLSENEVIDRLSGSRFKRALRGFQLRDLGTLLALPHGANFSVPGSGKTTVTYGTYEAERYAGRVSRMLVIAPLSAFESWTAEAALCLSPAPPLQQFDGRIDPLAEVVIANYHRLVNSYAALASWVAAEPTHVILDEAHRMKKGRAGQWGRAALDLAFSAARRDILTGTPAPQTPTDLEALFEFVWPTQARRLIPADARGPNPPADAGERIARRIRPLFVRTRKSELELPEPLYRAIQVPLTGIHNDIYRALLDQYSGVYRLARQDRVNFLEMGRVVMYLLEAATNPALLVAGSSTHDAIDFQHPPIEIPAGSTLPALLQNYCLHETPAKFIQLAHIIQENIDLGRKTLVWSNFVRNLVTVERMLARYQPAMVHGGIPSEVSNPGALRSREREIRRFRSDANCMVLLANPAAASEGLSLHDVCHDAIYLDRTFNAGQYLQSVDRIHRLGLNPQIETRVTILLTSGTVDELVDRRVRRKSESLGVMLDDPDIVTMALPDDEDYGPAIDTVEDLAALFSHLRGE
jgi:hypothetical protein